MPENLHNVAAMHISAVGRRTLTLLLFVSYLMLCSGGLGLSSVAVRHSIGNFAIIRVDMLCSSGSETLQELEDPLNAGRSKVGEIYSSCKIYAKEQQRQSLNHAGGLDGGTKSALGSQIANDDGMRFETVADRAMGRKIRAWASKSGEGEEEEQPMSAVFRLRGGKVPNWNKMTNQERWESVGFSLQPDLGPEDNIEVPMEIKLGDAAEYGDNGACAKLLAVRVPSALEDLDVS